MSDQTHLARASAAKLITKSQLAEAMRAEHCKRNPNWPLIGCFGEPGSYTEIAGRLYFNLETDVASYKTAGALLKAVSAGDILYGVLPIYNSTEGAVKQHYDALLNNPTNVVGQVELLVPHCLIANSDNKIEDITEVYSHPQALGQCSKFLDLINVQRKPCNSTSEALAKIKGVHGAAALASAPSAELYGMRILNEGVQDQPLNQTRFLVLSKDDECVKEDLGEYGTIIAYRLKHASGALREALGPTSELNVNLTYINSTPVQDSPGEQVFWMDLDGHKDDLKVNLALQRMRAEHTDLLITFGSYLKEGLFRNLAPQQEAHA